MLIVIFVVNLAISGVLVSIVQGSLLQQESSQLCPQGLCSYSQPYFLHSLPSFLQHFPQNDCILVEDPISQVVDVCNSDVFECLQNKLAYDVSDLRSQSVQGRIAANKDWWFKNLHAFIIFCVRCFK